MVNYSTRLLDATFAALADPTRRAILARLARGESSVTQLAEPFRVSLPAISKHLRVLERAGLLVRQKDGRVRRCRLNASPLQEAAEWIVRTRRFWEERLDALARYLEDATRREAHPWPAGPTHPKHPCASPAPSRPRRRRSSGPGRNRRR